MIHSVAPSNKLQRARRTLQ